MKRNILLIAVLLLSSLLIACGKPEKIQTADSLDPSTAVSDTDGKLPDTFAEAREREDFVVLGNDNQLLRGELWEAFLDAAARNEEARVIIARATVEGDPIYYHLTYRDNRYLLFPDYTHDRFGAELAKQAEEKEFLMRGAPLSADVLKAGHHGSSSSSGAEFLAAVSPTYTVISCGRDNDYGHPHEEALTRIKKFSPRVYITAEVGSVRFDSDGEELRVIRNYEFGMRN